MGAGFQPARLPSSSPISESVSATVKYVAHYSTLKISRNSLGPQRQLAYFVAIAFAVATVVFLRELLYRWRCSMASGAAHDYVCVCASREPPLAFQLLFNVPKGRA